MSATFETLLRLDAALVAKGHHPLTGFWRETLKRFYGHQTAKALLAAVGRGGAKSHTSGKVGLNETLYGDWKVPPGERHFWVFVSKSKEEAAQRLVLICAFLRALGIRHTVAGDTIELADMPRGFKILAAQIGAVSGFRAYGFSFDELAKAMGTDYANPAAEVCASLGAMTITHPGARRLLISSPFGCDGYFFEGFERGENEHQIIAHAASWVANPDGITEAAAHAVEQDPKVFAREYEALFDSIVSNAFERDGVLGSYGRRLLGILQSTGFLAIDASSLRGDAFAWVEGRLTDRSEVAITHVGGWNDDQQRGLSLNTVVDHLVERCNALGTKFVYGDQAQQAGLEALFEKQGITFKSIAWTEKSKEAAIVTIRRWMREGTLSICEHDQLKRELLGLRARLLPSGNVRYLSNGIDYASALITLAHAQNAGELVVGSGNALYDWLASDDFELENPNGALAHIRRLSQM